MRIVVRIRVRIEAGARRRPADDRVGTAGEDSGGDSGEDTGEDRGGGATNKQWPQTVATNSSHKQ